MASIEDRWLKLAPIKIGWLGMEWARFEREIRMAFDEGIERGVLDRRYEFLFEEDAGLPQGTAKGGIDAFHRLVRRGLPGRRRRQLHRLGDGAGRARQCAAGAADQHVRHRCLPRRVLLPAGQRRRRRRPRADRQLAQAPGPSAGRGDQPVLADRRGVLPLSSARSAAGWASRSPRSRRSPTPRRIDELAEIFGRLRAANADALAWLGYGGLVVSDTVRQALDKARLGSAAHHDDRFHAVHLGIRPARGLGRHRPVVPGEPADAPLPRALRRALRRGPVDVAERDSRSRVRHGGGHRRGAAPRAGADPGRA